MMLHANAIAAALGLPAPTAEQVAVIEAPLAPVLVVAGAGSGKTETMAARVVWLVANGHCRPDEVLGLTFTRKAAGELAERIGRRLRRLEQVGLWAPSDEEPSVAPTVSTYHAYAGRLVGEHALRLGREPGARLLSPASTWHLVHGLVERFAGPLDTVGAGKVPAQSTVVEAVLHLAGELAEHLREPAEVEAFLDTVIAHLDALPAKDPGRRTARTAPAKELVRELRLRREVLPLLVGYERAKRESESLDFADQMALAAQLARAFPDIAAIERRRYRAVLLDEFQDTSEAQLVLLRELFGARADVTVAPVPVMAVGDPHQSIYGWRGASATTLTRFPREFTHDDVPAAVLTLSTSWRNDTEVLAAANAVAAPLRSASRVPVPPLAARPGAESGHVEILVTDTLESEARRVADWILQHRASASTSSITEPPRSAAVLCRKRSQFAEIVHALEEVGLPVEVVGLGGLLHTPEVTDVLALLHVAHDPTRGDHLMRLLSGPVARLGAADLTGLSAWSGELRRRSSADDEPRGDITLADALDDPPPVGWVGPGGEHLSETARRRVLALRGVLRRLRSLTGLSLPELAEEAERALGLDVEVLARPSATPTTARTHLEAFLDVAADFAAASQRASLGPFLAWLEAAEEHENALELGTRDVNPEAVQVLTVHAAKGLEWDLVAVAGLEETGFPTYTGSASYRGDSWQVGPPKDKAWLLGLADLPFDLRGDRAGLPVLDWRGAGDLSTLSDDIDDFVLAAGEHAIVEERRLAYVAFTRARHRLLLTAAGWRTGRRPRLPSRFLADVRDAGVGEVLEWWEPPVPTDEEPVENPRLADEVIGSWPVPPSTAPGVVALRDLAAAVEVRLASEAVEAPAPYGDGSLDAELELLLAERQDQQRRVARDVLVPRHLSTSAVVALASDPEAFASSLRRPMPAAPATAARRGTDFHAWVEAHYTQAAMLDLDDLSEPAAWAVVADGAGTEIEPGTGEGPGEAGAEPSDADQLAVMQAHFLASEWADRSPVAVEVAVETVIDDLAIRGRIDAVFADTDGVLTIVDWKTGSPPHGASARARATQLAAYRVAYARLRDLPLDQVRAAFFYAATGETVWPDLLDEEGLSAVLAAIPDR